MPAPDRAAGPPAGTTRRLPEIQALRAIAVLGVVVYHLFPGVLRGGYAGVDVFFVISGFLITSHLLRELRATGRIGFAGFYARRARRLLPAATLVLLVTGMLTFVFLPERNWPQVLHEIAASAVYVENWALAASSVDYLAQNTGIASPVQHYWSLSVEEQFYLIWPLLLVVVWWIASRVGRVPRRRLLLFVLCGVFAGSLLLSAVQTVRDPGPAYFATQTRAWEFAGGGILALVLIPTDRHVRARSVLSWVGIAAIAASMLLYTGATPFPGLAALLPVAGTAAVIAAGSPESRWSPRALLGLRPVQYLGDTSYSLYLWHWPLVVFAGAWLVHPGAAVHLGIGVAAFVLAVLTKRFVEDPVRTARWRPLKRPGRVLALTASMMVVVLTTATASASAVSLRIEDDRRTAIARLSTDSCLGAASLDTAGCADIEHRGEPIPGTAAAPQDDVNSIDCWSRDGDERLKVCSEGPETGAALRVALVGDSHSNQYLASLKALAAQNRWRFDVYGKTGCSWSTVRLDIPPATADGCDAWRRKLNQRLTTIAPYDVIITSYSATTHVVASPGKTLQQSIVDGFVDVWKPVAARGTKIVAIKDNPRPRVDYLACIDSHPRDPGAACAADEDRAFHYFDGQPAAVKRVPGTYLLDLTRYFCRDRSCEPVIGDVIVYRDPNHLTSTYTRTLAPYLREGVLKVTGLSERKPSA